MQTRSLAASRNGGRLLSSRVERALSCSRASGSQDESLYLGALRLAWPRGRGATPILQLLRRCAQHRQRSDARSDPMHCGEGGLRISGQQRYAVRSPPRRADDSTAPHELVRAVTAPNCELLDDQCGASFPEPNWMDAQPQNRPADSHADPWLSDVELFLCDSRL